MSRMTRLQRISCQRWSAKLALSAWRPCSNRTPPRPWCEQETECHLPQTIWWIVALRQQQSIRSKSASLTFVLSADGLINNNWGKKKTAILSTPTCHCLCIIQIKRLSSAASSLYLLFIVQKSTVIIWILSDTVWSEKMWTARGSSEIHEEISSPSLPLSVMKALIEFIHSHAVQTLCEVEFERFVVETRSVLTAPNWMKDALNLTLYFKPAGKLSFWFETQFAVPLKVFCTLFWVDIWCKLAGSVKVRPPRYISAWCDLTPAALKESLWQDYLNKNACPVAIHCLAVCAGL